MNELEKKREEKLVDQLFKDLLDVTAKARDLGAQQIGWHGLGFFAQMIRETAPSKSEAKHFIKHAVKKNKS
tara:strand:+ start:654 stop:866 length:213 start_codon:yes stop_codon:yes gene_type:complete